MSEADIEFTDEEMNSFNELMLIVEQQNGVSFLDLNAFIDFYVKRGMNKIIEIPEFQKFHEKEMEVKERHLCQRILAADKNVRNSYVYCLKMSGKQVFYYIKLAQI